MKSLISIMGSMKTMIVLVFVFAFSVGYATIIERMYSTSTARAAVYNATWFYILLGLLSISLILHLIKFKIRQKPLVFILHFSWLVILLGAALTHYVGYEGLMHIREGKTASTITSTVPYFEVSVDDGAKKVTSDHEQFLSYMFHNSYSKTLTINGKKVHVKLTQFIPNVIQAIVESKNGAPIANMMITSQGKGQQTKLSPGQFFMSDSLVLDFDSNHHFTKPVIKLFEIGKKLYMSHLVPLTYLKMDTRKSGILPPNKKELVSNRTLYSYKATHFVLRSFYPHANIKLISNPHANPLNPAMGALRFKISSGGVSKNALVYGESGMTGSPATVDLNGLRVTVNYGSKIIHLPFKVKLDKFQLTRYPGSMAPETYSSYVTLIDTRHNVTIPYRIHMNHILEYRNFRLFQSSFDPDLKGTILSVNMDPGTDVTYFGYLLLAIGFFGSFFASNGRFAQLSRLAKAASAKKSTLAVLALALMFHYTNTYADTLNPIIKTITSYNKTTANKFGSLIVQSSAERGRMEPLNTLAIQIMEKIHGSQSMLGLSANQIVLGMLTRPDYWRQIKMIKTGNSLVNKLIGVAPKTQYVSFSQFFTDPNTMSGYKLAAEVDKVMRLDPKKRGVYDRAVFTDNDKVNVAYMVYTGSIFKMWPEPNSASRKWFGTVNALKHFPKQEANKVRNLALGFFLSVNKALQTGNWKPVNNAISTISEYQRFYGASVYPSSGRIKVELIYNKLNIFERLWPLYFFVGFALLILSFIKILRPKFPLNIYSRISMILLILFFIAHTVALIMVWYISGHAPWADGFESMTYIAWASVLAGFIFSRHSPITLAATSILAGLILFVAHLAWMNPAITNLVPVLNSYWLDIHVSMITASYGFVALGALLGFITLLLFILKNKKNEQRISLAIIELNSINEMSIMIGLAMLSVGTFLGGVWANQSWGHYWGWDPKEVWALVSILVYVIVVHIRFIKPIYTQFNYSVISLLAFTSILMTYFGVNYYLGGLHSYAKGNPVPIPAFAPISYLVIFIVIAIAFRNRKLAVDVKSLES